MIINYEDLEKNYEEFMRYAFRTSDYFTLTMDTPMENIPELQGADTEDEQIGKDLYPYLKRRYKRRKNKVYMVENLWEGHEVVNVYECKRTARDILVNYGNIITDGCHLRVEDLCFFRKNVGWYRTITHERMADVYFATKKDIEFLQQCNIRYKDNGEKGCYFLTGMEKYF